MIRHVILSSTLACSLALSIAHAADRPPSDATAICEAAVAPMRTTMATLKQGGTLTPDQEALWRTWNARCRHASWQQALAEGLPPVPVQPSFHIPMPPPSGISPNPWGDFFLTLLSPLAVIGGSRSPTGMVICTHYQYITVCR